MKRKKCVSWLCLFSSAGSLSIVSYGIMRGDLVLIVRQSFGVVAYIRNLMLIKTISKV